MICRTRFPRRQSVAPPAYVPSPEEISERAAEVRQRWSPSQRRRRAGLARVQVPLLFAVSFEHPHRWMPQDS